MFKFRSGTHGLNGELGGHRGREGKGRGESSACCVMNNMRVLVMFCGIVWSIVVYKITF